MNDERQGEPSRRDGVAIAAVACLAVCTVALVISIVGIARTPMGPEGDPDASDGRWYAMFECFPVFALTIASGIVLPFALGWRGRKAGMAIAAVLAVGLVLATVVTGLADR